MPTLIHTSPGDPATFSYQPFDLPPLQEGEVCVATRAIGINPIDVKTARGGGVWRFFEGQSPAVLGWDLAGVIEAVAPDVAVNRPELVVGARVFGLISFPGQGRVYATHVMVKAADVVLIPPSVSFQEAAAAPIAAMTVLQGMALSFTESAADSITELPRLVLIHAAAGGVGHFAVQLAKLRGWYVIGTASPQNHAFVKALGADEVYDYHTTFEDQIKAVDWVLDTIGGENLDRSIRICKPGGTVLSIVSGRNEEVATKAAAAGRHDLRMVVRSDAETLRQLQTLLVSGALKVDVSATYAFDELAAAHAHVATGRTVGKVVVERLI